MNQQDERYFEALTKYRASGADLLEQPYMRGVKTSVVEKYSDQAHFIYELLQNADDAGATSVRFELHKDELIFAHNGTRRFSISNPDTEEADSDNGKLGDINAITSIANSNKTMASIGKFGVGFKAVFQYTQTPSVYDPDFQFRIERFIVPVKIDNDYASRKSGETLFVFPFDHNDRSQEEAYEDISHKLNTLVYPILFLTNLNEVCYESLEQSGKYTRSVCEKIIFENTEACLFDMSQICENDERKVIGDKLWLFSRTDEQGLRYSVGYELNKEGKLTASHHAAFCFFPTKENTGLNFMIQAPFLLTDSREGIKAGEKHNQDMIALLSILAADSISYLKEIGQRRGLMLIDDAIFKIIPYDESKFNSVNDKNRISFLPFYSAIKNTLNYEELLPSFDGFASAANAYWATVPQIAEVFSNEQLAVISENPNAKWVFASIGRDETSRTNKKLAEYIDSITNYWYDHERIIKSIKISFIEMQSVNWLHKFYKYIFETSGRIKLIKSKPIFLNQENKAVAAFDKNDQAILFLPTEEGSGYQTLKKELLENSETAGFVKNLGISEPSLKDEIYNKILPIYQSNKGLLDTRLHFKKFFRYYKECPAVEQERFIELIKKCNFILYRVAENDTLYRGKGENLYFPNEDLKKWFSYKPDTRFIAWDEYQSLITDSSNEKYLLKFLMELGVSDEPRIVPYSMGSDDAHLLNTDWHHSTRAQKWTNQYIDGCKEIIETLTLLSDIELSVIIWNQLLKYVKNGYDGDVFWGRYDYFYRSSQHEFFCSEEATRLLNEPWLFNNKSELVSAKNVTVKMLSPVYDLSSSEAIKLLGLLEIKENSDSAEDNYLTDEQRAKIKFADDLADIPFDELNRFVADYRSQKQPTPLSHKDDNGKEQPEAEEIIKNSAVSRVAKEISKRAISGRKESETDTPSENESLINSDEDDYTKPSIDFSKKIEQAKQRGADEIESIARLEALTQQALTARKYTYGWFKAILELEAINSGENNANSREISITFSKVEHEEGSERTLILKHPSRYIPYSMEDLSDIPLVLHFFNQPSIKVAVEVVNVKSYTLRAKLKTNAQIEGVDLSLVEEAKIEAQNPVFLLEELRKQFNLLGFEDDYNLQENLCENIEFVFGPPGTGKTTYLASKVIYPIMQEIDDLKVLVLTPTNKAADVLVRRLMNEMGADHSYNDWLIRFGTTNDKVIEQSNVLRDKSFDIRKTPRNVTVTTIARFPYDYFLPDNNTRLHLNALQWDYIIIDEASMIPLINIVFPLYKKTPKKFIIAGDPFQIEPITTVTIWKNENIYTMVKLDSFSEPITIPYQYPVKLLTTQYRSIPEIGEIFSHLAYDGVLKHHRTTDSQRQLLIDDFFEMKSLNIIKFPVSKYESIYHPKRLQNKSNYQVYSALFIYEFIKYLSSVIKLACQNELFRIGVIAPYRAQADLVDKLMSSFILPNNIDVQVGTIHGFQGDECDIIIALFNPPPKITSSREMFLNKLNIINVAISRSRDYLFIIMPDDETANVENLMLIKKVEELCKSQTSWNEQHSQAIEALIFGSENYIEDNSFSTSHQLVNVYGKPERRYEVRSEDAAVDVQIHNIN